MSRRKKNLFGNKAENGKRLRRVLLWICAAGAGALLLSIVAWYQLLAYLQSESFRATLSEQLRQSLRAQGVELQSPLRIDGDRVEEEGIRLSGAGALTAARAGHISLDLDRSALLNRTVHIRKISVDDGEVLFESASPAATASKKKSAKTQKKQSHLRKNADSPATTGTPTAARQDSFLRPNRWNLELMECKATDITLKRGDNTLQVLNCALTSSPMKKGGWQHQMENGRVHTPFSFLRGASLKSATLTHEADRRDLTDCRIMLSPGEMRIRAHQDISADKWSANINLNKANIAPLLHGDWQKRVTGELFGKLTLAGSGTAPEAAEGYLSLQQGVLEGLPLLSLLPSGGGYPYRHLELDKAECRISYPYTDTELNITDAWLFDGINVRAKNGLLRMHGHVIIGADGTLGGTLTIGIPAAIAETLPAAASLRRIFNAQGEAGYAWLNINLSGTVSEPEEDLSVRCAALIQGALPQTAENAAATAEQMLRAILSPNAPAAQESSEMPPAAPVADPLKRAADEAQKGINNALRLFF